MNHSELLEKLQERREITFQDEVINRDKIAGMTSLLQSLLFPDFFKLGMDSEEILENIEKILTEQMTILGMDKKTVREKTDSFFSALPEILSLLNQDIKAIYDGDPAATSYEEILICYPGFRAIAIYRLAHVLYELSVPIIPRVVTEYAHSRTGIDINPGATIGRNFCIDHGTGIIIGETAEIGDNVKIYQGVTIGAKSFAKDANGNRVKGGKRHPTIGNNVVIYANATILGGETRIGNDCVIGSNSWITYSVPDGERVR